jgi:hypothetical protein
MQPTSKRSILKSLTWIFIIILTIILWTGILKALQPRTSALGATQAPGPFRLGQSTNFNPGGSIPGPFFYEHNVYFLNRDGYKLNLILHRKARRPHYYGETEYYTEFGHMQMLHNYYYVKYKHRNHRIFGVCDILNSDTISDPKGSNYIPIYVISPKLGKCIRDKNRILYCFGAKDA